MKTKFHMLTVMFTVIGFAFAGCSKDEAGVSGDPNAEYILSLSEVAPSSVKINVVPKDKDKLYFVHVMTSKAYQKDMGSNPKKLKDFVPALFSDLSSYYGMTIAELLSSEYEIGRMGSVTARFHNMPVETDFIAFAVGVDENGNTTDDGVVTDIFTTPALGKGPELTIEMNQGDLDGNNTSTMITISSRSTGVISGEEALYPTETVAEALAQGATYDDILDEFGFELKPEDVVSINTTQGITHVWSNGTADTEYTYMLRVFDGNGITTGHEALSTAAAGSASMQTITAQASLVSDTCKPIIDTDISKEMKYRNKNRISFMAR